MIHIIKSGKVLLFADGLFLTFTSYKFAMDIKNNILETIGNTPRIRLNKITKDFRVQYWQKWIISTPVTQSKTGWL